MFARITGSYPIFKSKETEGEKVIYTFFSPGIIVFEWYNRITKLENVLSANINPIQNAGETKQIIKLDTVPADQGIEINLNKYPHALIAGITGFGKSVVLRAMLWQRKDQTPTNFKRLISVTRA